MQTTQMSNSELLSALFGDAAAAMMAVPLGRLFFGVNEDRAPYQIADVARELVARAMIEGLEDRDCLSSPTAVKTALVAKLSAFPYEVFSVLYLDTQNRLICYEELFRGTLTQTSVYPREVVKKSLMYNASAVIFAHNHPSGIPDPSRADELLTKHLKQALALVDVKVLDHFVVGGTGNPVSFAERGLI